MHWPENDVPNMFSAEQIFPQEGFAEWVFVIVGFGLHKNQEVSVV